MLTLRAIQLAVMELVSLPVSRRGVAELDIGMAAGALRAATAIPRVRDRRYRIRSVYEYLSQFAVKCDTPEHTYARAAQVVGSLLG